MTEPTYHRAGNCTQRRWVAVTGAGGFIGQHLVANLLARGENVVYISRSRPKQLTFVGAEKRGQLRVVARVEPSSDELLGVEALIMLAGLAHQSSRSTAEQDYFEINTHLTKRTARAALEARCGKIVYVSTVAVYGDGPFSHPLKENAPVRASTAYARSKWAAEQTLKVICEEYKANLVCIRAPLVFAPDAPGSLRTLRRAISAKIPLPFKSIQNRRSLVAIEDLVSALVKATFGGPQSSLVLNVSNFQPLSTPEITIALSACLGERPIMFSCPHLLLTAALSISGLSNLKNQIRGDLLVVSSEAQEKLGWQPAKYPARFIVDRVRVT